MYDMRLRQTGICPLLYPPRWKVFSHMKLIWDRTRHKAFLGICSCLSRIWQAPHKRGLLFYLVFTALHLWNTGFSSLCILSELHFLHAPGMDISPPSPFEVLAHLDNNKSPGFQLSLLSFTALLFLFPGMQFPIHLSGEHFS